MLVKFIACLLFLSSRDALPIGSTDPKENIDVRPAHEITAERILHLGQDINKKVRQEDPLSLSNRDGDMRLATQFQTKRSAALDVNSQPSNSYSHGYGSATYPYRPSIPYGQYDQQALQSGYYQQNQNYYGQQYSTPGKDNSNQHDPNNYYSNPQITQQYYNVDPQNGYSNMQNLYTYSHPQLNYRLPQQYYNYQPQYLQPQQNFMYQSQPNTYYHPSQNAFYYQPMQDNAIWNAYSYFPSQSTYPEVATNLYVPHLNEKLQNKLHKDTKFGTLGHLDSFNFNSVTPSGNNGQGKNTDVLLYHALIDALYDEHNLINELGASAEYYDQ